VIRPGHARRDFDYYLSALLAELDRETARRLHADAAAEGLGQGVADQPTLGF